MEIIEEGKHTAKKEHTCNFCHGVINIGEEYEYQKNKNDGEFYMIVGIRELSEMICQDVMKALKDPAQFDPLGTLWGVETLNTLEVYRMRKDAAQLSIRK